MAELKAVPQVARTAEPTVAHGGHAGEGETVEPTAVQMVEQMAAQTVAPFAEDSILARLVAVDRRAIRTLVMGTGAAAEGSGGFFLAVAAWLVDANAIDELLGMSGLRTPFLRVAKNGTTLRGQSFTAPSGGVYAGMATTR